MCSVYPNFLGREKKKRGEKKSGILRDGYGIKKKKQKKGKKERVLHLGESCKSPSHLIEIKCEGDGGKGKILCLSWEKKESLRSRLAEKKKKRGRVLGSLRQ